MFRREVIVFTVLVLLVSAVRAQESFTLTYDQLVEGHVKPALPVEFTFSGAQGDRVVVSMTSAEFDTTLELLDSNGSVIAFDDDSGVAENALLQTTLPASGSFTIRAGSYDDQQSGHFHLSLALAGSAGAPPTGEATYGQTLDGHLAAGRTGPLDIFRDRRGAHPDCDDQRRLRRHSRTLRSGGSADRQQR